LVVVTIFGIIAMGIASSFVSGVKLWNRAKNMGFSRTEVLLNMEMISRDLRQGIKVEEIGFQGSAEQVSFPTVVNDSLVKVIYLFDAQEKELVRRQIGLEDALAGKESSDVYVQRTILSPLEEFSFSYFEKTEESYAWSDTWPKDKGVFRAIKLQGRFKGEDFVKTIFIPAS
jgi:type II secretory pathway pseudopilin PulG